MVNGDILKRFWSKVNKTGGCWVWTAYTDRDGYSQFALGRNRVRGHRFIYEATVGPIPVGLVIDHICNNPSCVRVDHLRVVTNKVNTLRGNGSPAKNARKKECKNEHKFNLENTYLHNGARYCKMCRKLTVIKYAKNNRNKINAWHRQRRREDKQRLLRTKP